MVGPAILVKPITAQGQTETDVYFPGTEPWYDIVTYEKYASAQTKKIAAPIEKIPAFQRGGHIVPRKMRLRRSSALMVNDPYTLVVALDSKQQASGLLYMDDEKTFNYQKGMYRRRHLNFAANKMTNSAIKESPTSKDFQPKNRVERVVIVGLAAKPSAITAEDSQGKRSLTFKFENSVLTIRKPDVLASGDWSITLA